MSKSHSPASTSCTSVILEHSLGPLVRCMNIQNPSKTYILYNLQSANISRQCFFICSCFKGTMCSLRAGNECPRHSGHLHLYLIKSGKNQEHPTRSEQSDTRFSQIQPDSRAICDVLWWSMTYRFLLKKVKAEKTIEPGSATFPSSQQSHHPPGIILCQPHRHCTGTAPAGCMCHWAHTCPPGFP